MKRGTRTATRDYGDLFLAAILIGIVVVVLGLMMAVAHSTSRHQARMGMEKAPVTAISGARNPPPKIKH